MNEKYFTTRAKARSSGYGTRLTIERSWVRIQPVLDGNDLNSHARIDSCCTQSWFIRKNQNKGSQMGHTKKTLKKETYTYHIIICHKKYRRPSSFASQEYPMNIQTVDNKKSKFLLFYAIKKRNERITEGSVNCE